MFKYNSLISTREYNRTRMSLHEKRPKFRKSLNRGIASIGDIISIYLQYPKRDIYRISKGEVLLEHNGFLVVKPLEPFTYQLYRDYTEVLLYFPSGIPTGTADGDIQLMGLNKNISIMDFIAKIETTDNPSSNFKKIEMNIIKYIKPRLDVPKPQYKYVNLIHKEITNREITHDDIIVATNEMLLTPEQIWDWYSYSKQNNIVYNTNSIRSGGEGSDISTILDNAISSYFKKSETEYRRIIKNAIKIGKSKGYQTKVVIPDDGILNVTRLDIGDWFRFYNLDKGVIGRSKIVDYLDYDGVRLYFIAKNKSLSLYSKMGVVVFSPRQGFSSDRLETTDEVKELFLHNIKSANRRGNFDLRTEVKRIEAYNIKEIKKAFGN